MTKCRRCGVNDIDPTRKFMTSGTSDFRYWRSNSLCVKCNEETGGGRRR